MNKTFNTAKRALKKADPRLANLFNRHGTLDFEPRLERSPFESLVRSIAHQQLSGAAASTILRRFLDLYPKKDFPSPNDILKTKDPVLRTAGFSFNKIKAIRGLAEKTLEGIVPGRQEIMSLDDQEIIDRLTQCYGVGVWTVQMMLIFQLGRLDIWPTHDLGIQKGYKFWLNKRSLPKPKQLLKPSEIWMPYRTVVALYLWREADQNK